MSNYYKWSPIQYHFCQRTQITYAKHWRFRPLVKVNLSLQLSMTIRLILTAPYIPYLIWERRLRYDRLLFKCECSSHAKGTFQLLFTFNPPWSIIYWFKCHYANLFYKYIHYRDSPLKESIYSRLNSLKPHHHN
jgi:hypothetical protein